MDVTIRTANEYEIKIKSLKQRRRSVRKNLAKLINSRYRRNFEIQINKVLKKIQHHKEQNLGPGVTILRRKILPWTRHKLTTDEDFHNLRITSKKTRYALEALEALGKSTQPLQNLQYILGRAHDLEVLQDLSDRKSELREDTKKAYRKALKIVQPTLCFAEKQLSTMIH